MKRVVVQMRGSHKQIFEGHYTWHLSVNGTLSFTGVTGEAQHVFHWDDVLTFTVENVRHDAPKRKNRR